MYPTRRRRAGSGSRAAAASEGRLAPSRVFPRDARRVVIAIEPGIEPVVGCVLVAGIRGQDGVKGRDGGIDIALLHQRHAEIDPGGQIARGRGKSLFITGGGGSECALACQDRAEIVGGGGITRVGGKGFAAKASMAAAG